MRDGFRIGVDVGGTNTDAVLLVGRRVVASIKRPTSADVESGVRDAITALMRAAALEPQAVDAVMIGTTHFTNAIVQSSGLSRVAAIRIGLPAGRSIPPFTGWPEIQARAVHGMTAMIGGGYQFDGREIGALDERELREVARRIADTDIREIAVSSVFAQVNAEHETRAADVLAACIPDVSVTLSHEIGRIGLIERENAALMNASLRPLAKRVADAFRRALADLSIDVPFFVSQNDGTLMSADVMRRYPALTVAAGPTNSLRGAYFLTGLADAIVVDIGGTTSDIGVLAGGFPRQSSASVDVGGIRTNFRMPDILSIGLGGGSRVRMSGKRVTIGPDSVGLRLLEDAIAFGGATLTATDVAVAAGYASVGKRERTAQMDASMVDASVGEIHRLLAEGIDRMKTSSAPVPLILVGGGAILVDRPLQGVGETIRPAEAGVANAVGAAIGQVSGEVDRIYNCGDGGREEALADAREEATKRAIEAGAAPDSVAIVAIDELPLQYLPGGARRILCRAVGDLAPVEHAHG